MPPTAEKYRKQIYGFLKDLNKDIDVLLELANEEQRKQAQTRAASRSAELPKLLFKDSKYMNANYQS